MSTRFAAGILVAGLLACPPSRAEDADTVALAKALPEASVSLEQGLKAGEHEGKPISGKFEIDNGALQLSIYTINGDKFSEVVVDHKSGTIKKADTITDSDDLKAAKSQTVAKAKLSLDKAVEAAVSGNGGYRVPMLTDGEPVAAVTLMKGENIKKITQKLD